MKFLYEYRTSANERKSGVIRASSRDAAYSLLRGKGIKPTRVTDAPGVFNKLFGKGKRWLAIGVLSIALLALLTSSFLLSPSSFSLERQQIYGDPAILRQYAESGWIEVFPNGGDRLLAAFAQPGLAVDAAYRIPQRGASAFVEYYAAQLAAVVNVEVPIVDDDGEEVRTMKRIVAGMKAELREYLADGGTSAKYFKRLLARQEEESQFRQRASAEVGAEIERGGDAKALLRERNAELRTMGILPVLLK